jgi:hypothetical protein
VTQTSTARPLYQTNTLNGLPVVEFDGTNDTLNASTASDWTFLHDSTGSTLCMVFKAATSADPDDIRIILGNTNNSQGIPGYRLNYDDRSGVSRNEQIRHTIGTATTEAASNFDNDKLPFNSARLLSVLSDPSNGTAADRSKMHVDGGTVIASNTLTVTPSSATATNPLQLGCDTRGSLYFLGYFAEVVICDAVLSSTDREKLEGYLAHKWGLESNLPNTHPYRYSAP